jgi:exosortase/archaeosortase family protein
VVATVAIAASFFGYSVLPDLVRAGLWMLALVAILGPAGPWVPRAGLLLLSLPVVATAEFYLGYPLRAAMAVGSVPVLRLLGYEVIRQGAALRWAGETVLVDAPCSGIQMLWTGLFAACTLAAAMRIGGLATAGLLCCTAGVVAIANLLRCALLFVYEVKAGMPPAWIHEGVGLALFAGALGIVLWLVRRTRGSDPGKPDRGRGPGHSSLAADWVVPLLGVLLLAAAVRPLFGRNLDSATDSAFPGWPAEFEGRQLSLLLPNTREARFAAGFPGKVAGFTDGDRKILMRWVGRETRKLHPAAHCLRGLGYEVQPGPVWRDSTCRQWGTAIATREGRLLKVRERIVDTAGGEWTDVSAWWWAAWRGDSAGPWWAVTVFEGDDS